MYKLIAIDMDGTLLKNDKTVSDRTKKTLKEAREKGVNVVIATGRPIDGVSRYLEELDMLGENDYVLSYNGGLVLKTKSREIISKIALTGADLYGLITPKNSKYTEVEANINNIKIGINDYSKIEDDHSIIKVMMIDEPEVLQKAVDNLPKEVYEKYTVVRSTPYFLEFLNKEVNKGTGVKLLADHLGVKQEEVMTFGDAENDLDMIVYAGMGVAMANGFEEVKEAANYITDSNEEDGVAKAIEKFVLS